MPIHLHSYMCSVKFPTFFPYFPYINISHLDNLRALYILFCGIFRRSTNNGALISFIQFYSNEQQFFKSAHVPTTIMWTSVYNVLIIKKKNEYNDNDKFSELMPAVI